MTKLFRAFRRLRSINAYGEPGDFGVEGKKFHVETCREKFAIIFNEDRRGFYYFHHVNQAEAIALFIRRTEQVLGLNELSQFDTTNLNTAIWVEPSLFWRKCPMRRSLLTLLLRTAMLYRPSKDNYEEALFGDKDTCKTKRAIMRFLFGFTQYEGPPIPTAQWISVMVRGWVSVFEHQSEETVKMYLVSPEKLSPPSIYLKGNTLWV